MTADNSFIEESEVDDLNLRVEQIGANTLWVKQGRHGTQSHPGPPPHKPLRPYYSVNRRDLLTLCPMSNLFNSVWTLLVLVSCHLSRVITTSFVPFRVQRGDTFPGLILGPVVCGSQNNLRFIHSFCSICFSQDIILVQPDKDARKTRKSRYGAELRTSYYIENSLVFWALI